MNNLLFVDKGVVGESAAPSGDRLHIHVQQGRQHRRRGGGVADAHFPDAQQSGVGLHGDLGAGEDGLFGLGAGHGRAGGDVAGARRDASVQHRRVVYRDLYPHVADSDPAAEPGRQHRSPGLAPGEVDRLLQGDDLGGAGHPFGHHAVVGGKDQQLLFGQIVVQLAGDARQLDGKLLQPPQAARRLGQLGLPAGGGVHGGPVQGPDGPDELFQILHTNPFFFHKVKIQCPAAPGFPGQRDGAACAFR